MKENTTAGVIIIGNEILTGKVRDVNSYFLSTELRSLGVSLTRISVIPDDTGVIGKEVSEFSEDYDFVFTSGGIGPTHDDITIEGVARGFNVNVVRHPELERIFRNRYGEHLNPAILKMAEVPEGAELIMTGDLRFPVLLFRNVYIFPGIPEYLRNKFTAIRERFRSPGFHLRRFYLKASESDIAGTLNGIVGRNRNVTFGSYPILNEPEYSIIVTAESKSAGDLKQAEDEFLTLIPQNLLVRVE
jgi:molybdenum cofactor synthesis domain-containing protein